MPFFCSSFLLPETTAELLAIPTLPKAYVQPLQCVVELHDHSDLHSIAANG